MPSCYPDCVHTPEEQQQIARENYEWHERTFGPPPVPGPPPPSGCKCKKKEVEMTTEKQFETMVRVIHIVETAGNVVVGAGIFVGSVGATVYFCTETAWIGCLALGIEIIPVPSYAGYELARGSIDELDEMSVEEDCQ